MGDAAMNVAVSGGGSQRVVKEGWLQKRGTAKSFIMFLFIKLASRRHHPVNLL